MPCLLGMLENVWLPEHSVKTNHSCATLPPSSLLYFCMAFIRLSWGTNKILNLTCAGQRRLYWPTKWPLPKRLKVQVNRRPPSRIYILWMKTTYFNQHVRKVSFCLTWDLRSRDCQHFVGWGLRSRNCQHFVGWGFLSRNCQHFVGWGSCYVLTMI